MTIKVGDKVRYTGPSKFDLTHGKVYEVCGVYEWGFEVLDDVGDANGIIWSSFIGISYEPVDDTKALPPTWDDMNDAEKGAMLLADHEGKVIEYYDSHLSSWLVDHGFDPHQNPDVRYRVAEPEPKEPREWWIVDGCAAWLDQADAINSAKTLRHADVVHVREVIK